MIYLGLCALLLFVVDPGWRVKMKKSLNIHFFVKKNSHFILKFWPWQQLENSIKDARTPKPREVEVQSSGYF